MKTAAKALLLGFLVILSGSTVLAARLQTEKFLHKKSGKYADAVSGEIIIKFKPGAGSKKNMVESSGLVKKRSLGRTGAELYKLPKGKKLEKIISKYENDPDVLYIEPNYIERTCLVPNDTEYVMQWAHHNGPDRMESERAWDISTGSSDIVIAVIDSGVDLDHPDFSGKLVQGYDFYNDDSVPRGDNRGAHKQRARCGRDGMELYDNAAEDLRKRVRVNRGFC
jgi:thermitase